MTRHRNRASSATPSTHPAIGWALVLALSVMVALAAPLADSVASAQSETVPEQPEVQTAAPAMQQVAPTLAPTTAPPAEVAPPTEVIPTPTPEPTVVPTIAPEAPAEPPIAPTPLPVPDELACGVPVASQGATGWQFESACTYTVNSPRAETRIAAAVTSATSGGWSIALRDPASGAWSAAIVDTAHFAPGSTISFGVRLIAPADSRGGEQATVQVTSEIIAAAAESRPGPAATIAATVPEPAPTPTPSPAPRVRTALVVEQPNPSALSCTEPNGDKVLAGDTITYQCSFNVTYSTNASMDAIFTGPITTGWSVSITGTFGGTTYSSTPGSIPTELRVPAKGSLAGTLTISVRAPANGAKSDTGTVSLTTTCTNSNACRTSAQRPSAKIVTTISWEPCSSVPGAVVTASLTGATLPSVSYSHAARTNTGSATLNVQNPSRCSGWNVNISGTDLRYSGSAPNQAAIPAGNLRVTAPGKAATPLSPQEKPLVTGGGTNTSYAYPLAITLDIPAGSAAGTYTTTITVSTTSAP